MLACDPTTPQDYPECSGFSRRREREWGHPRQRPRDEAPATVNEGEIAVAPKEELHAAPLSGKRVLALWNALPGVEKRRKVGDPDGLIDHLWSAIEALPDPKPEPDARRPSNEVIAMLRRPEGATVDEVVSATGWQRHTVRGVFSGTLKKKLGLTLVSVKEG
jgi:hypothetical protein